MSMNQSKTSVTSLASVVTPNAGFLQLRFRMTTKNEQKQQTGAADYVGDPLLLRFVGVRVGSEMLVNDRQRGSAGWGCAEYLY